MATIAVGDIHGNLTALNDLLEQIRSACTRSDTIVFLGDYMDRGPETKGCVDAILAFRRDASAEVVCLLGNHEEWFLRTMRDYHRHSWLLGMEAFETIRSYSVDAARILREAASSSKQQLYAEQCALPYDVFFDCIPAEHLQFFEGLRTYHQSEDCVCTHGGLDPSIAGIREQSPRALVWGTNSFPHAYDGLESIVYGHRNNAVLNADGWPMPNVVGRTIGVDTISHGVLTAVRLPDQRVFQSARYDRR